MTIRQMQQSGFSLIELMIAVTLGLLITAGVLQVFLATKQTYKVTEAHAVLQDNARFALEILSKDIRQAGYAGCKSAENINVQIIANDPVPAVIDATTVLTGSEGQASSNWSPALDSAISTKVNDGTDVITIIRADSCGGNLVGNLTSSNANAQINYPNSCNIKQNDVVMIADCEDAHVFKVTNTPGTSGTSQTLAYGSNANKATHLCTKYASLPHNGTCDTGTTKLYGYDAEIYLFSALTFYVGKDSHNTLSLYKYDQLSNAQTQLVEGIEDMQIEYGLDDNDDDIIDRTADAKTVNDASDWGKVVSAQISLLSQSLEDNLTVENQIYTFNGSSRTGTDGRLRRVFTTNIAVRNRVQ